MDNKGRLDALDRLHDKLRVRNITVDALQRTELSRRKNLQALSDAYKSCTIDLLEDIIVLLYIKDHHAVLGALLLVLLEQLLYTSCTNEALNES